MAYSVIFAQSVKDQLQSMTATQRKTLLEAIEQQLTQEPLVETRNRILLRPNPVAPWELRVGPLRVFYEVVATPESQPIDPGSEHQQGVVQILAVGQKRGNELRIAGKKIEL